MVRLHLLVLSVLQSVLLIPGPAKPLRNCWQTQAQKPTTAGKIEQVIAPPVRILAGEYAAGGVVANPVNRTGGAAPGRQRELCPYDADGAPRRRIVTSRRARRHVGCWPLRDAR